MLITPPLFPLTVAAALLWLTVPAVVLAALFACTRARIPQRARTDGDTRPRVAAAQRRNGDRSVTANDAACEPDRPRTTAEGRLAPPEGLP